MLTQPALPENECSQKGLEQAEQRLRRRKQCKAALLACNDECFRLQMECIKAHAQQLCARKDAQTVVGRLAHLASMLAHDIADARSESAYASAYARVDSMRSAADSELGVLRERIARYEERVLLADAADDEVCKLCEQLNSFHSLHISS